MSSLHHYLFSLEELGIKLGLDQIRALVEHLGHPDRAFRSIVVAGTNGKGSTTAMIERGLRAAGYRTGRYTSPHLVDLTERFVIDGRPIDAAAFLAAGDRVRVAARQLPAPPSFFEATTALALEAFRDARVEIAVLEVGLGGRLDATNVVFPMGVAITAIDFDHERYLGDTIEAIAGEKAGIVKAGAWAVLGRNPDAVQTLVRERCGGVGAEFIYAPRGVSSAARVVDGRTFLRLSTPHDDYGEIALGLRGRHQIDNAVTAVRVLETAAASGQIALTPAAVSSALADVDWPGRLELRSRRRGGEPDVLIDGAHNPAGARALTAYVTETYARRLPIVLGVMADKKIHAIAAALEPAASCVICTAARSPRAEPPARLAARVGAVLSCDVLSIDDPIAALDAALTRDRPVVVAGSLYLAGEIRAALS